MIRESLREAAARIRDTPVLWATGLYLAALFALDILLEASGNTVVGAHVGFLGLCGIPFFAGGSYGAIRAAGAGEKAGLRRFAADGVRYFFRILLPGAVVVSAALVTGFLVMVPVSLILGPAAATPLSLVWVGIPFAFFTFFFDTAAVFEDRKVFDSIRRSVEFVTGRPGRVVLFYLASLAIGFLIFLAGAGLWSFAVAEKLQPLADADPSLYLNMTPAQVVSLIGVNGLWAGVGIGFVAVAIGGTLLAAFKACFFRRAAAGAAAPAPQGEFDEKGRWYRY
ncbi:MAG TPA: hypothetical protein VLV30_00560 [Methanomicrobiales archaeon]|nr:hypothetical protein [Methanomicrobiales archaeon]